MAGPGSYLIGEEEKKNLLEVIEAGWLYRYADSSSANFKAKVLQLEQKLAEYVGIEHVVAVNSGTAALFVALAALGIGPGDEVIVPGYTFIASIGSIVYSRAIPILAEIDESLTLDPRDVRKKITKRTKAIMLVHMLGNPGHIEEIRNLAREHNLYLVEDCAQSFGATYQGKSVGTYGDIGTFSFNFYKTITAGDGGAVVMKKADLYRRAFAIHDQGHLPLRHGVEQGSRALLGLNFKMTELTAAVLLAQLKKVDALTKKLKAKKRRFKDGIKDISGLSFRTLPDPQGEIGTLLTVFLPDADTARRVGDELGCGVIADSGWHVYNNMEHVLGKKVVDQIGCPFTCPYYTDNGGNANYEKGMLPQTDAILNRAINISVGVTDAGLGSGFGISILSDNNEIDIKVERFRQCVKRYL
jgi:dTDP-4-amino-4,6-dideoxygalactose transaminase